MSKTKLCPRCRRILHAADFQGKKTCPVCLGKRKGWLKQQLTEALLGYGGKCFCCGVTRVEFLVLIYENLNICDPYSSKVGAYLLPLKVSCRNCLEAHKLFGYCPHRTRSKRAQEEAQNLL